MPEQEFDPEKVVEALAAADAFAANQRQPKRKHRRVDPLLLAVVILAVAVIVLALQVVALVRSASDYQDQRTSQFDTLAGEVRGLSGQIDTLQRSVHTKDAQIADLLKQNTAMRRKLQSLGVDPNTLVGPTPKQKPAASNGQPAQVTPAAARGVHGSPFVRGVTAGPVVGSYRPAAGAGATSTGASAPTPSPVSAPTPTPNPAPPPSTPPPLLPPLPLPKPLSSIALPLVLPAPLH